jgi:hypothetical protein
MFWACKFYAITHTIIFNHLIYIHTTKYVVVMVMVVVVMVVVMALP